MQLIDYLDPDFIIPDLASQAKSPVLKELLQPFAKKFPHLDRDRAHTILMEREGLGSTGIGDGVAIPHGKMDDLNDIVMVVGRSLQGVDFSAIDSKPCHIFFLVLAPEQVAGLHLRILAHVSRLLKDAEFRRTFLDADGRDGLWSLLKGA